MQDSSKSITTNIPIFIKNFEEVIFVSTRRLSQSFGHNTKKFRFWSREDVCILYKGKISFAQKAVKTKEYEASRFSME